MRLLKVLALTLFCAPPLAAQEKLPIEYKTLGNGLDVIVIENPAIPLVTVELNVKNGAFTESPQFDGLSHLYEHMFFKANRAIPNQEAYLQRLSELGGMWNGTTSEERVNYYVTVGRDSLLPAMQFMEDAIRTPLFRRDELERERPVVLGEYDRQESSPFFHLTRAVDTLLWSPGYYSRKNVIGNREVIATTTPEMMREIQSRYYVPNNTALILSGDITAERGFQLAERVFGDWPRGEDPFAEPVANPPPLGESKAVIVERPVGAATLLLSWHGPSVGEDPAATYAADIFLNVIRSEASGFQQRLVQSGLATGASLGYYTQDKTGPIQIFAQTTPEKLLELERAILDEVRRMAEPDYVTPEQLEAARNRVEVGTVYEREQSRALAHTVGFWWAVAGIPYYKDYTANMQRATREDIAKFVQDYMISKPYVAGVLISPADRQRINLQPSDLLMGEVQR